MADRAGRELPTDTPRTKRCPECGCRTTVGLDGTEYGHIRGRRGGITRCPKRPSSVDPVRKPGSRAD